MAKAHTSFQAELPNWPGMYVVARASTMPSTSPPTTAPLMFPMPPRTAAVNAFMPAMNPIWKSMLL